MKVLLYMYIFILALSFAAQILLYYKGKEPTKKWIYIFNMGVAILLSWFAFTAMPSNFYIQRGIAMFAHTLPIVAVILKLKDEKFSRISKLLLTGSLLINFTQLFI